MNPTQESFLIVPLMDFFLNSISNSKG